MVDSEDEVVDYSVFDTDDEEDAELARLEAFVAVIDDYDPIKSPTLPSTACDEDKDAPELEKINSALELNQTLRENLKELHEVLIRHLHECIERPANVHKASTSEKKPVRPEMFPNVNCGKPYFRDETNFPAPPDEDTTTMAQSTMSDFSEITSVPGWTVKDKRSLSRLLLKMSLKIRKDELKSQIAQIKREGKNKNHKQLKKKIAVVHKEIKALRKKTLKQVALPIDEDYDWDTVASRLNKPHNASEYRFLWKVYLHPDINKSAWSKPEDALLLEIAKKYEFQNWKAIAEELNTGRSGYQCFVYYKRNISNTCTGKKWTKEEEEYLRRLILYYKEDDYIPWGKVASAMENRTKVEIYKKYFRFDEKRKGRFIPEEDAVIIACIQKFGVNFRKMAEFLPGRSASQIRLRFGVLGRKRTSDVWTIEEDRLLLQTIGKEDLDINFSTISKLFPGKTRTQTQTRYLTLIMWMKGHPSSSVENAPRLAARCLSQATENLNKAIENLQKTIKIEVEKSNIQLSISGDSPIEVTDDAILNFLTTEHIKEEEIKRAEMDSEQKEEDCNGVVAPAQSINMANLHNLIIFLKGNLDLIAESSIREEHLELLKSKPIVNPFTIKNYARQLPEASANLDEALDTCGDNNCSPLTYVLPPNNATITGCNRFMVYLRSMEIKACGAPPLNINLIMRFNPVLKSVMLQLKERFNQLFIYPLLLFPVDPELMGKMGLVGGFPIPKIPKAQAETGYNTTTVDLVDPNAEQKNETCLPNIVMDEKEIFDIEHME